MTDTPILTALAQEDVAELARLRAFAWSIGVCGCDPQRCDTKTDLQCRAREALTGKSNTGDNAP